MLMVVPGLAWGDILWRGDFETGDRTQYSGTQMVSADRLQVVTSPVAEGRYALKATVQQGDDPINSSGNRNELVYQGREKEGSEYYYRWKVMFAEDFPSVKTWQLFTQWHHDGCCGSPPVEFFVYGEEIRLTLNDSVTPWTTKLVRGVWHEFIFHVKWSPDPKVGFVELWHNGQLALPKRNIGTMYAGDGIYLKLGLYRSDTVSQVGVVYHDGFMQATALSDVLGTVTDPVDPPTDAGTPATDAGTPATDPGTPKPDAGTPAPVEPTPEVPGQVTTPGTDVVPEPPFNEQAPSYGCSVGGGPLAALALVGLVGVARLRRRRR
jgi:MYXO-CTERM domain-containing protein